MGKTCMSGGPHGPTSRLERWCEELLRGLRELAEGALAGARSLAPALLAALVALGLVLEGTAPVVAAAASFDKIDVVYVPESEIEGPEHSWSIDYEGWDLDAARGFERSDDIGQYRKDVAGQGAGEGPLRNTPGWVARIDAKTPPDAEFSVRATGGRYGSQEIDAVISLSGWTYLEPEGGWEEESTYNNETRYYPTFQTGVFMADEDRTVADDERGIQSLNFYTVGLADVEVEISFVKAGTDEPVELRGHLSTIDLDVWQSFSFGGAVTVGRLSQENDVLYLSDNGTTVESGEVWLDPTDPDDYRDGMVEAYFDTTGENRGVPLKFHFGTSWGVSEDAHGRSSESIFYLNTEYLTVPSATTQDRTEVTKSADKTGEERVSVGDEVAYAIDYTTHEQGVNCRWGYRYTGLELVDELPAEMSYVEGSALLYDGTGTEATDAAGEVVCEDGVVRFVFDEDYLQGMPMEGETYRLAFRARLDAYPASGELSVTNRAFALVNGTDENRTNDVVTNLSVPSVSIEKSVDSFEGHVAASGDVAEPGADDGTFEYVVRVANQQEGTVADGVTVTDDSLPEGMSLASGADGSPSISLRANGEDVPVAWSGDRAEGTLSPAGGTGGAWSLERSGTGWRLALERLAHGTVVEVSYLVRPDESVSGWQVENVARATAENCEPVEASADAWVNQPHLMVEKNASEQTLSEGDEVTYRVRVTNATPGTLGRSVVVSDLADARGVELLRDTLRVLDSSGADVTESCEVEFGGEEPANAQSFVVSTNRDLVSGAGERPVWEGGRLASASGENPLGVEPASPREEAGPCETELVVEYRLRVVDAELAGETVKNVAEARTTEPDTSARGESTVGVVVEPGTVVLDKAASLAEAAAGDEIAYRIVATAGTDLEGAVLSDSGLPACVVVDPESVVATVGGREVEAEPVTEGTGFSLALGEIAEGDVVEVSYVASVLEEPDAPESATNTAAIASPDLPEPVSDAVTVKLVRGPAAELAKEAGTDEARVGEAVPYVVTATALRDLTDVLLSDAGLPEGAGIEETSVTVRINDEDAKDVAAVADGTGLSLDLGDLEAGDVVTLSYDVEVEDESLAGETLVNTAKLEAAELEEPLEASAEVRVEEEAEEPAAPAGDDEPETPVEDDEPKAPVVTRGGSTTTSAPDGSKLPSTGEGDPGVLLAVFGAGVAVVGAALRVRRLIVP